MPSEINQMACQISIILCTFIHLIFFLNSESKTYTRECMLFSLAYILYIIYLSIMLLHVSIFFSLFRLNRSAQIPIDVFVIMASTAQTVRWQIQLLWRRPPSMHPQRRPKSRWKRKKHHTVGDFISILYIT